MRLSKFLPMHDADFRYSVQWEGLLVSARTDSGIHASVAPARESSGGTAPVRVSDRPPHAARGCRRATPALDSLGCSTPKASLEQHRWLERRRERISYDYPPGYRIEAMHTRRISWCIR